MHKFFSLLVALCLIFFSFIASAENITNGNPIKMDDFTLNLEQGIRYDIAEKKLTEICIQVYPYANTLGDTSSFNFVWCEPFAIDASILKEQIPWMESQSEQQYASYGIKVLSFDSSDPIDSSLSGVFCTYFDSITVLSYNSNAVTLYQRQYHVGEKGYVITIGASSEEQRNDIAELLSSILVWN